MRQKLQQFDVTHRWPPENPDQIQLYTLPTPNGIKASVMLEELGLAYEAHRISISGVEDQKTPEFLSLNPNGKIPAMIDPNGPDGQPMALWESGAMLIYLADKTGMLLPKSGAARYQVLQWLMFQMGGVGPMFGQMGYFHKFAGSEIEDPRPRNRYINEAKRLLQVIEGRLAGRDWLCDSYSIADIATAPWVRAISFSYQAEEVVGWADFPRTQAWVARWLERPAVQRGVVVGAA